MSIVFAVVLIVIALVLVVWVGALLVELGSDLRRWWRKRDLNQ